MKTILLSSLVTLTTLAFAQKSKVMSFPKASTIIASEITEDWNPVVQNLEAPIPGGDSYRSYLQELKQNLPAPTREPMGAQRSSYAPPTLVSGFDGNPFTTSVPNDNDVAISNDGKVLSVINVSVYAYDASTGQTLFNSSLQAFSASLGLPQSKYDPRVMYDPIEDRFIIVFLNSFDDSTSFIVVAFSDTNDPTGAWHLYSLPGNPNLNGTWTDFPMLGLTEHELFITGNSILNDTSWQEGFVETLLWQVNKHDGFAGDSLRTRLWHDIKHGNRPIRNLCPAKGGTTLHSSPDQYFISNRNFDVVNDTFFLVYLSDTMNGNPQLTVQIIKADLEYGVPPVARQPSGHTFETNDGRMLSAYYENDLIHFVGNVRVPSTGYAGIYHGILSDPGGTPSIKGAIISPDSTLDLGYPNIVYTGRNPIDECVIVCDHSGPDTFPGVSAFYYREGSYSDRLSIKTGNSYVNLLTGIYERWGDYTGAQRVYNDTGVIWVSGNYGRVQPPVLLRKNATWIAQLGAYGEVVSSLSEPAPSVGMTTYPNPFEQTFTINFSNPNETTLRFVLYDIQGRLVKVLLSDRVKKGENQFSFSTEPLLSGTYVLSITSPHVLVATAQVVKN